jgi:hypothetical protein
MVIDWRNAEDGAPDLDTALTAVILGQVAVAGSDQGLGAETLASFLHRAPGAPLARLDEALARRRADRGQSQSELDHQRSAVEGLRSWLASSGRPLTGQP